MRSILVVDDTPDCREPLARLLRVAGYNATTASNGVEALRRLPLDHPDLVLLDLMMPEMDGVEFLRAVRDSQTYRELPVVILTALADGPTLAKAMALGPAGTLIKSQYTADQLLACVESACPAPRS